MVGTARRAPLPTLRKNFVGWVEQRETHQMASCEVMGFALLNPSYDASHVLQRHPKFGFGLQLHLIERDAVAEFDQRHAVLAVLVDVEYRPIPHHQLDPPP